MLPAVQALTTLVLLIKECMIDQTKVTRRLLLFPINMRKQKQSKTVGIWLCSRGCVKPMEYPCAILDHHHYHNCTIAVLTSSGSNHAQLKGALQCDHGGIQKRGEGQVHIYNFVLFSVLEDCTLYCSTFEWDAELFTQFYTHGWCRYCYLLQDFSPESLAEKCSSLEKLAVPSLLSWWRLLTEKWYFWAHTHFTLLRAKISISNKGLLSH